MAVVCPTILADNAADYAKQMGKIAPFVSRVQIDLMDGEFAKPKSIPLEGVWWPAGIDADIHFMYANPFDYLDKLIHLNPHLVIIHVEANIHHMHFAAELHKAGIKVGLAALPQTPVANIEQILHSFDYFLIFSGDLGHFGGEAKLELLSKAKAAKGHHPDLEIGWDGGINDQNARQLFEGGVDVLNVGGFIQKAEDPFKAFNVLVQAIS